MPNSPKFDLALACSRYPRSTAFASGLLYSVCMVLAFPPFDVWPLVFVCCVPLFWVISRSGLRTSTLAAFAALGVIPFWLYEEFWISRITGAGYIPMCFLLALFAYGQVFLTATVIRRRGLKYCFIPAALIWCGIDVFRGEIAADGYPWYFESHPLVSFPLAASLGSVVGAYGVTLVVLLVNGLIADARRLGITKFAVSVLGLLLLLLTGGIFTLDMGMPTTTRIACVQTNVPQELKMGGGIESQVEEWKVLEDLTRKAVFGRPSLIVWPETMKPGLTLDSVSLQTEREAGLIFRYKVESGDTKRISSTRFADDLLRLQKEIGVPLIVGEEAFEGLRFPEGPDGVKIEYDKRFNSAFVVSNGVPQQGQYNKLHLTPFGEYMPYIRAWPWLQQQLLSIGAKGMSFDLAEGKSPVRLNVPVAVRDPYQSDGDRTQEIKLATPICFEIADAPTVRKLAAGADVLVTLTNDGWFGDSDKTREQHVQLARWRAIETGLAVVRCANTGISCAIGRDGGFLKAVNGYEIPLARQAGVFVAAVPVGQRSTPYMSGGWMTPWIVFAGMLGLVVWGLFGKMHVAKTASPMS